MSGAGAAMGFCGHEHYVLAWDDPRLLQSEQPSYLLPPEWYEHSLLMMEQSPLERPAWPAGLGGGHSGLEALGFQG